MQFLKVRSQLEVPHINENDHEQLAKLAENYRLARSSKSLKLLAL